MSINDTTHAQKYRCHIRVGTSGYSYAEWADAGFYPHIFLPEGVAEMIKVIKEGRISDVWSPEFHNAKYVGAKYGL